MAVCPGLPIAPTDHTLHGRHGSDVLVDAVRIALMEQYITVAEWHATMESELTAEPTQFALIVGLLM
jgi:hypothetical protein